jgi:hypothetical protein
MSHLVTQDFQMVLNPIERNREAQGSFTNYSVHYNGGSFTR